MKWIPRGVAVGAVLVAVLPSCKKSHTERATSDLKEAGYKLTPEDWFKVVRQNNLPAMKQFVSGGFPVDTRESSGDSALHAAAAAGATEAADYLLDRKLPVDVRGALGRTPLMAAVLADQPEMTGWLLRQGADPKIKDDEGYNALMLAAREGSARSVGELAAYDREGLDSALLLAAMGGRTNVIDALTNHGASVYAKMEDGRTPLMLAAESGHADAVQLLMDLGSSRFATDEDGRTAAQIAKEFGHPEIVELVSRDPKPAELALDSPEELATEMETFVERSAEPRQAAARKSKGPTAVPIQDQVLSRPVAAEPAKVRKNGVGNAPEIEPFAMPPLVMRHYREKEIPMRVESVRGETAVLQVSGKSQRQITVKTGDVIPGSNLMVVRVRRRMEDSKLSQGGVREISVVEVKDRSSGATREWVAGFPSAGHDPIALVEDSATGKHYLASPGQKFHAEDGGEFLISEVRPNQLVIREMATGEVRTIPLRGPRG